DTTKANIEPYAVLSHTWGHDEVTFQDMMLPNVLSKEGYSKITETCRLALAEDLNYVWIDTCCIDKTSSAELTETINSMFELYKKVAVCYVYLQDLDPQTYLKNGLKSCRWITRGWTLQELLASEKVHFYDRTWRCRGSKVDWAHDISIATGIHHDALLGRPLQAFSIAQRMSWASDRETTRAKDLAYYLLGIFEVHMPLIYGEGKHAFRRLQEEIVKRTNELTIFAWNQSKDCMNCTDPEPDHDGLFAPSPSNFYTSHDIIRSSHFESEFTLTNRGLKLKHHI
ncbi:HET-domain-containing protein, partial [Mollisia scopiformis]